MSSKQKQGLRCGTCSRHDQLGFPGSLPGLLHERWVPWVRMNHLQVTCRWGFQLLRNVCLARSCKCFTVFTDPNLWFWSMTRSNMFVSCCKFASQVQTGVCSLLWQTKKLPTPGSVFPRTFIQRKSVHWSSKSAFLSFLPSTILNYPELSRPIVLERKITGE